VTGEKLVFDKTPPATIDRYNRSKLFLAWDGDPSILRSFRFVLLVRTLSARDQQHHAGTRGLPQLKATLRVDWIRPTRTEAEELRWMILFLNRQLRKKHPYVTSWFLSRGVARVQPKAAL
jgi:hypothetical protein